MAGPTTWVAAFLAWASRRRFPTLLALTAALFAIDLAVPDPIPMMDEALLGLATLAFAAWRRRDGDADADLPARRNGDPNG